MRALAEAPEPIEVARRSVPSTPGLYAIHGNSAAWAELGLGVAPDSRPLYVGKAEDSLITRDVKTHFGDGRTGSSTVRRSIAALLASTLDLRAIWERRFDLAPLRRSQLAPPPSDRTPTVRCSQSSSGRRRREWDHEWRRSSRSGRAGTWRACRSVRWQSVMG
ncbi:MAG: GIY-YIG nuclease family protein, partial [Solirubrobacteraceae bacterium]